MSGAETPRRASAAVEEYLDLPLGRFLELVASRRPAPGGGSVAAAVVAAAAGLAGMTARLSSGHLDAAPDLSGEADRLREEAAPLVRADAEAYGRVLEARRSREGVQAALSEAAEVPLQIAGVGARVARLAARLAGEGNPNLKGDAIAAVLLAEAATSAAAELVRINEPEGERVRQAGRFARAAAEARRTVTGDR